jgi:hypothetical protein
MEGILRVLEEDERDQGTGDEREEERMTMDGGGGFGNVFWGKGQGRNLNNFELIRKLMFATLHRLLSIAISSNYTLH